MEEFSQKFINHVLVLWNKKQEYELLYGDAYIEFTDTKIEVKKPDEVKK